MIQQKLHGLISIPAKHRVHDIPVLVLPLGASAKLQASKEAIAIGGIEQLFAEANEPF